MIKTYGERGDSLLGRRVKHEIAINNSGIISSKNIPCESKFVLEHTELRFDGPDENYRPWMEFSGYIKSLTGEFPCNIEEIRFSEKKRFDSCFRYDFSDDELCELAKKGLFSKGYVERGLNEPDIFFKGNELEFPVLVDVNIVKSKNGPQHAVFVDIQGRHYIEIDAESSGYTEGFAQHYADLQEIKIQEAKENQEMFMQQEEFIESIGDIELLDVVPENSHMLAFDEKYGDDMGIDEENEISLFEKYGIKEDVDERNQKYEEELQLQEQQYKEEQKAKENAIEQEKEIEKEEAIAALYKDDIESSIEDEDRLLNIDMSDLVEIKEEKVKAEQRKRAQIARQQHEEMQKIEIPTYESMDLDALLEELSEEEEFNINEFSL